MSALFTALMEGEDKGSLAGMVCDMWNDRERLAEVTPLISFSYDVLMAAAEGEKDMAAAVERAGVAAGLLEAKRYDPDAHIVLDRRGPPLMDVEGFELTDVAVDALRIRL